MSDLAVQNRESEQEVMPSFDFLLERETERNTLLAEHRAWLKEIKRERPLPKTHYRVAVYIRYFNQTRYEDYLSAHKKQFLDTLALCPNWKFVGFYVDEGSTAPNMENAPEWSRLLQDCYEEKVNLIITQKASNISKKLSELSFCTRLLAALPKPVGVYFVSEDIYTLAEELMQQDDIVVIDIKDYIAHPKANCYRSLHLILDIPIFLSDQKKHMRAEVQLRTIAMDFWASLEHKINYKFEGNAPQHIKTELVECARMVSDLDARMLSLNEEILSLSGETED